MSSLSQKRGFVHVSCSDVMLSRMQRRRVILYRFIASRSSHARHAPGSVLLLRSREEHASLCLEEQKAGLFCLHATEPRLRLAMRSRCSLSKSIGSTRLNSFA